MREFKHVLREKLEDGTKNPYKGYAILKLLPFMARNEASRAFNFQLDADQNVKSVDLYDLNDKMAKMVKENLVSMEIKKGKEVFTNFDDLDYDDNVAHLYGELGGVLIRGINLGKN